MAVTNKLIEKIIEMKKEGNWISANECNPKRFDKSQYAGPFHLVTYFNGRDINNLSVKDIEIDPSNIKSIKTEIDTNGWDFEIIDQQRAEELARCSFFEIGFKKAILYKGNSEYELSLSVTIGSGETIKLLVFPKPESNVCVFHNKEGQCSFWSDGRVNIVNNRPYWISTNQRLINRIVEENNKPRKEGERKPAIKTLLNKEFWGMNLTNDELKVRTKAINYLGKVEDLRFPESRNGVPYNTIWLDDPKVTLTDVALEDKTIGKYIRISSLSQGGVQAQAGPVGILTNKGYQFDEVTQLIGNKGKSDVSATTAVRTFKQSNNKERCLIVLAELIPQGWKRAINISGNCISSESAYRTYISDFSLFNNKKAGLYRNGHKIYIESANDLKRIKGAAIAYPDKELFATLSNGTVENKIVVIPPRELTPTGEMEEDIGKFEELCRYRDDDSKLQMVELNFQGQTYNVPALYCWVYEDAAHSATTSLRIEDRKLFNYGAIRHLYNMNGFDEVASAFSKMLDHQMVAQAMNIAQIEKSSVEEIDIDDFIKSIK